MPIPRQNPFGNGELLPFFALPFPFSQPVNGAVLPEPFRAGFG
jgi:hypothetical protein